MKKLQSKNTDGIGVLNMSNDKYQVIADEQPLCGNSVLGEYDTLDALMQEWQDYEEPLIYYVINEFGIIESYPVGCISDEDRKQIGNYFETKEEAEKAVEKLKAWTRLKKKGFKFTGWYCNKEISFRITSLEGGYIPIEIRKDLDILFGGEE